MPFSYRRENLKSYENIVAYKKLIINNIAGKSEKNHRNPQLG
jgi:hypothetical protein